MSSIILIWNKNQLPGKYQVLLDLRKRPSVSFTYHIYIFYNFSFFESFAYWDFFLKKERKTPHCPWTESIYVWTAFEDLPLFSSSPTYVSSSAGICFVFT